MNYKDVLIDAQKSTVAAYTTFLYTYINYDNFIACFVEGQDYEYYRYRVESMVPEFYEVSFYPCNGRIGVEKVKDIISSNCRFKKNIKIMYFADRDYDLKEKINGIYYTDYYSVENFYCQRSLISKILKYAFNIDCFNPDYEICMKLFDDKYSIYQKEILKINGFARAIRIKEIFKKREPMKFENIKYENMVKNLAFDNFEMKNFNYIELQKLFKTDIEITEHEYADSVSKITSKDLRGKWELKFFIWFLENLKRCIKNGNYDLAVNNRIKLSFDHLMLNSFMHAVTTNSFKKYVNYIIAEDN